MNRCFHSRTCDSGYPVKRLAVPSDGTSARTTGTSIEVGGVVSRGALRAIEGWQRASILGLEHWCDRIRKQGQMNSSAPAPYWCVLEKVSRLSPNGVDVAPAQSRRRRWQCPQAKPQTVRVRPWR